MPLIPVTVNVVLAVFRLRLPDVMVHSPLALVTHEPLPPVLHVPVTVAPDTRA